jgi:hypothetical protein
MNSYQARARRASPARVSATPRAAARSPLRPSVVGGTGCGKARMAAAAAAVSPRASAVSASSSGTPGRRWPA